MWDEYDVCIGFDKEKKNVPGGDLKENPRKVFFT